MKGKVKALDENMNERERSALKEYVNSQTVGMFHHRECQANRDGEPMKSGRHCPFDSYEVLD